MKVTPVASAHAVAPTQVNTTAQSDARDRAIAKLTGEGQSAPVPVNANAVSPEEVKAVTHAQADTKTGQSNTDVEATTPQTTAEEVKPKQEDQAVSEKYQILARKERQLRAQAQKQAQEIQAREEALKAKEAALAAKEEEYKTGYIPKNRLKQDAYGVLEEEGITYDEVTQQAMTRQPTDPRVLRHIEKLEAKIQKLEASEEETRKNYINSQDAAYKAAVKQIEADAKALVTSNPDEYEAIQATKSVRDVVELIERTYKEEGRLMSVEEACTEVENYLAEEAWKLANMRKIKSRQNPSPATKNDAATKPQQNQQPQQMKTLTNAAGTTRKLTSKERAILAFKGELKS